jgi:hypothetical protein
MGAVGRGLFIFDTERTVYCYQCTLDSYIKRNSPSYALVIRVYVEEFILQEVT